MKMQEAKKHYKKLYSLLEKAEKSGASAAELSEIRKNLSLAHYAYEKMKAESVAKKWKW